MLTRIKKVRLCKLIACLIFLQLNDTLLAQSFANPTTFQLKSPQVSNIEKVGMVPVNLSTGQISPSIKLYELSTPEITIPITLSYSNNGLRLGDKASWAGLGWNVFAGGVISQNVRGLSDFSANGLLNSSASSTLQNYLNGTMTTTERNTYQWDVINQFADSERDLFSFNFLGRSGSFYFDATDSIKQLQKSDLEISYNTSDTTFSIKDERGFLYAFTAKETSTVSDGDPTSNFPVFFGGLSWYLTSITTPNNDIITFTYVSDFMMNETMNSSTLIFGATSNSSGCSTNNSLTNISYNSGNMSASQMLLQTIEARTGKIVFNTTAFREDVTEAGTGAKGKVLSEIEFQDNNENTIRKTKFIYGHFLGAGNSETNRLKLTSVRLFGTTYSSDSMVYSFNYYNESAQFPALGDASKDYDHWGYYNGAGNYNVIPAFDGSRLGSFGYYYGADKNANSFYSRYGMLKEIHYPTGGRTEFEYEGNKVDLSGYSSLPLFIITSTPSNFQVGGNRIKRISYFTNGSTPVTQQNFEYSTETSLKYEPNYLITKEYLMEVTGLSYSSCGNTHFVSNRPMNSMPGSSIEYTWVTVKEDLNGNNGYSKTTFSKSDDIGSSYQPYPNIINTNWRGGSVLSKEIYKNIGIDSYEKVSSSANSYLQSYITPMNVKGSSIKIIASNTGYSGFSVNSYSTGLYTYFSELFEKSSNTESVFSGLTELGTTTNYYYESNTHVQPTRKTYQKSDGQIETTKYYYAKDFSVSTSDTINALINNNTNVLIRKDRLVSDDLIESQVVRPDLKGQPISINQFYSKKVPYPVTSSTSILLDGIEYDENEKISFDSYGNTTQDSKHSTLKSYLWSYSRVYPVAEVANADTNSIAFTSFESDGNGNWSGVGSGNIVSNANSPTGNHYYTLTGTTLQKAGLSSGETYIISYWSSTGDYYSVSGTVSVSRKGATINGWTYCEEEVTGATTISVSGTGNIDELRLYPKGALMVTRTYVPLVGVSSECDASNRITYYEYDSMGRVITIKDKDRNILKSFDYKYQQ